MNKSIAVIINASSGASQTEQTVVSVRQAFKVNFFEPEFFLVHPGVNVSEVVHKALTNGHRIIVAGGGDGTMNAVASQLLNSDVALGILPLGTFNHLARDLNIPLDISEAVKVLINGHKKKIDVAEVNGKLFLNNSSIGIYSKLVGLRKNHQKKGWSKRIALLKAMLSLLFQYSFLNVEIEVGGERELHKTPLVFVGNNRYQVDGLDFGSRNNIDSGKLCMYTIEHRGRLDMIKLSLQAFTKKLTDHDQFSAYLTTEAILETRKNNLRVAVDGEIVTLTSPLHYKIKPLALTVLIP